MCVLSDNSKPRDWKFNDVGFPSKVKAVATEQGGLERNLYQKHATFDTATHVPIITTTTIFLVCEIVW